MAAKGHIAMSFLTALLLAAILALPTGVNADSEKAIPPAQAPAATAPADAGAKPATPASSSSKSRKKDKKKKVKKSSCVSPAPDSGLPDYCRSPYWEPKDWDYIRANESGGAP